MNVRQSNCFFTLIHWTFCTYTYVGWLFFLHLQPWKGESNCGEHMHVEISKTKEEENEHFLMFWKTKRRRIVAHTKFLNFNWLSTTRVKRRCKEQTLQASTSRVGKCCRIKCVVRSFFKSCEASDVKSNKLFLRIEDERSWKMAGGLRKELIR